MTAAQGMKSPDSSGDTPLLTIGGLRKSYGEALVLKGIDLTVKRGELVALIGPSGSGKSTLLRCINRLEEPSAGQIVLDGTEVTSAQANINQIRRHIGMVFQAFNLYPHLNAEANVTLALRKVLRKSKAEASNAARAALDRVGLKGRYGAFPGELSGGQQQRVGIARAMALEPKLFLFDEPTSALDPELVSEVLNVMREMRNNHRTMIVVTHEMAFARDVADRVIFMDNGLIVESGTPDYIYGTSQNARLTEFLRSFKGSSGSR